MTEIVLTGGSGFLGSRVREELERRGKNPHVFVSPRSAEIPEGIVADITDPKSLEAVMPPVQCVIHCAGLAHQFGETPEATFAAVNQLGTTNVIAAAAKAGARRFVLVSSVSVYGSGNNANEDSPCAPQTPYARSKRNAEQAARQIASDTGMSLVILRLATLYGPDDPGNIRRLIDAITSGRFVWLGDGSNRKSLLYVTDAARACVDAATLGGPSGIYNVVAETVTVREIVEEIGRSVKRRLPRYHVPAAAVRFAARVACSLPIARARQAGETAAKWLRDDVYDGSKFSRAYRFEPRVSLQEGIAAATKSNLESGGHATTLLD